MSKGLLSFVVTPSSEAAEKTTARPAQRVEKQQPTLQFNLHRRKPGTPIIKVVGVGSGGMSLIDQKQMAGVSTLAVGTDLRSLRSAGADMMLLLSSEGAGLAGNVHRGRELAEESVDRLRDLVSDGLQMIFIVVALGGGTGTGVAPVIAREARRKGVLTVAVATLPFRHEGRQRIDAAMRGLEDLQHEADSVMLLNQEILLTDYADLTLSEAFACERQLVSGAIGSVVEVINREGYINVDFNDVKAVLLAGGRAVIGTARAGGPGRITKAINDALHSPLFLSEGEQHLRRMLFNLSYNADKTRLLVGEINEINDFLRSYNNATWLKYGIVRNDEQLGDDIRVTIVAAEAPFAQTETDETNLQNLRENYSSLYAALYGNDQGVHRYYYRFTPSTIDNDEVIALVAQTPTFARTAQTINTINQILK